MSWRDALPGLGSDRIDGRDGGLYMERFYVRHDAAASVRFHRICASDEQDPHDHPWAFASLILDGSYREHTAAGTATYGPGDFLVRRAADVHRLELVSDEVWTFVTTGPVCRKWGFHTARGWVPWREYFGQVRQW